MDLTEFVQRAKLWNRDPGPQEALLIRKLKVEGPETILHLYEQMQWRTVEVYDQWFPRPEPRDRFESHKRAAQATNANRIGNPAPPQGASPKNDCPTYEQWLRNWSRYQVLTGNYPPADDHFDDPSRPSVFDYFEGFIGNAFPYAFREAYKATTDAPWPYVAGTTGHAVMYLAGRSMSADRTPLNEAILPLLAAPTAELLQNSVGEHCLGALTDRIDELCRAIHEKGDEETPGDS